MDLKNMKALATAATPGPWSCFNDTVEAQGGQTIAHIMTSAYGLELGAPACDAAFIAAANPATVLEMAELIERLESTLAAERDEHIATHRQLAAAILRGDLGWARYEEANADRRALRSHAAQPVAEFEGYEDLGDRSRPLIRLVGAPIKAGTLLYAAAQPAPSAAQCATPGERAALEAARNAAYPVPDSPHSSVNLLAVADRMAFTRGWEAARHCVVAAAQPEAKAAPADDAQDALKHREQGRAEALNIILSLDAETGLDDYINSAQCPASGEHDSHWDEAKLRELLSVGDATYAAFDKAEAAYWEYQGHKDEADRAKAFAENMHSSGRIRDVLAKAGEYDLIGQLCTPAAPAPATLSTRHPVSQVRAWAKALRNEKQVGAINGALIIQMLESYADMLVAAGNSQDAKDAARYRWLREKMHFTSSKTMAPRMTLSSWIEAPDHDPDNDWKGSDFDASVDAAIDAAMLAARREG